MGLCLPHRRIRTRTSTCRGCMRLTRRTLCSARTASTNRRKSLAIFTALTMTHRLCNSIDNRKTKRTSALRRVWRPFAFLLFMRVLKFFYSLLMYIYGRGQGRRHLHHPHHPHGPFPVDPLRSCNSSLLPVRDFQCSYATTEKGSPAVWAGQFQSS